MLTKKHFEDIARLFREADIDVDAKRELTYRFCGLGHTLNPRFDGKRFYAAVFCLDFEGTAGCASRNYSRFLPEQHTVLTEKQIARKVKRALTGQEEWR